MWIAGLSVVLMLVAALFRYLSGPFYWGNNSDPSYFYLYNFLYLLEGQSPQFVDHPGTPVDLLGALVVRFFPSAPHELWLSAHAQQGETVLTLVWFLMMVLYTSTFFVLGAYVLQKSQDRIFTGLVLLSSLWLMIVPAFNTTGIMPISANVNSDTMMMTADNGMMLTMMWFYFSANRRTLGQAVGLGLAVAFALSTKFTALPFLAVGFCLLVTWPQRVLFVGVALSGFVLMTFPIWGSYGHMLSWVKGLIVTRGMHGSGGEGFNAAVYFKSLRWITVTYWFFVILWILGMVLSFNRRIDDRLRGILRALAIGGVVQVMIVAKQTSAQYMAPMLGISSLILALLHRAFPQWWQRGYRFIAAGILICSVGLMAKSAWDLQATTGKTRQILETIRREHADDYVCPFYRSSTPGFGYVFWNNVIMRDDYGDILKKHYPDLVYYDIFGHDFKDAAHQVVGFNQLKQHKDKVLIYGSDQSPQNFEPYLTVKKVYSNGGSEALFEVQEAKSNLGMEYLQFAKVLFSQARYEDAYKAAFMSQQLGVGEDLSGLLQFLAQKIQKP